jgi:transcriptional regulator with XRE-family HTH domain
MFLNMPRSPKPDPALAAAVRRLREDSGLTREALAFHAGITTASLARIELAQATPGWDTIRRIAGALDMSISRLAAAIEAAEEGAARPA